MANQLPNPPPGFDDLPVREQLAYVQSLWDRIVEREHSVPLPEAHRSELARRVAEHGAAPDNVRAWAEVEDDLRSELARRRER